MNTIKELAQKYASWFETATRGDDTDYIRLKTEDKHIKDLIYTAHNNMMPDDYKYQFIHEALEAITEHDNIHDIVMECDIYTSNLLKWVNSNLTRIHYCDEAIEQGAQRFIDILQCAQLIEKEEVLYSVIQSLETILENEEQ